MVVSKIIKKLSCFIDNEPIMLRIWPTITANKNRATTYAMAVNKYSSLVLGGGLLPIVEAVLSPNKNA